MSISSLTRKVGPLPGNGVARDFAFGFKVFVAEDLRVILTSPNGGETELTMPSDFTVTLNADQDENPGGNVHTITAPETGYGILIVSGIPETQPVDLQNQDGFYPEVVEGMGDRNTALIQQLSERSGRALTLPISAAGVEGGVPVTNPEPGALLAWDSSGQSIVSVQGYDVPALSIYGDSVTDTFSGDGAETVFELSEAVGSVDNLNVSISGVVQVPGSDFAWIGGRLIEFAEAPPEDTVILVRYQRVLPQSDVAAAVEEAQAAAIASGEARDDAVAARDDAVIAKDDAQAAAIASGEARDEAVAARDDAVIAKDDAESAAATAVGAAASLVRQTFNTRSEASLASIPAQVDVVVTSGFSATDDGGGATYVRRSQQPTFVSPHNLVRGFEDQNWWNIDDDWEWEPGKLYIDTGASGSKQAFRELTTVPAPGDPVIVRTVIDAITAPSGGFLTMLYNGTGGALGSEVWRSPVRATPGLYEDAIAWPSGGATLTLTAQSAVTSCEVTLAGVYRVENAPGCFQSADGAWWEIQPSLAPTLPFSAFGIFPDEGEGFAPDPDTLGGRWIKAEFATETDQGAAIQAAMDYCAARDIILEMDWVGPTRVLHSSIQLKRPSGLKMFGQGGGDIYDRWTGLPAFMEGKTYFLRTMNGLDRWISSYLAGGVGEPMDGGWDEDFIVAFNNERWASGSSGLQFIGGDAITYAYTRDFRATRVGGIQGYRHGVNLTCPENTRSGSSGVYPDNFERPTKTALIDCWGANCRDDQVTTHGVGSGAAEDIQVIRPRGHSATGDYTSNSNGVEIDDDSVGALVVDPVATYCAIGFQIKGHSDAKAPNRCEMRGTAFINFCAAGFEVYHSGHGNGNESPTARDVTLGNFVIMNPRAHEGGESIGDSNIQSYRNWRLGDVWFDGADTSGPQILMLWEGAGSGVMGNLYTRDAAGWSSGLRITSTASQPGRTDTLTAGAVVALDDQGPARMLHHSGGLQCKVRAVSANRNVGLSAGTAVADYTNHTSNFCSIDSISGGANYTDISLRSSTAVGAMGSAQFGGQLVVNNNVGIGVSNPTAGVHVGASDLGAGGGQPYIYAGSSRVAAITQNFMQAYTTGNTAGLVLKANSTSAQIAAAFETSSAVVGYIYTIANGLTFGHSGSGQSGLYIAQDTQVIRPATTQDGQVNFGSASARWNTIFATTGTIDTSDARLKSVVADLSDQDAVLDAIGAVSLKLYQWLDAVALKGEDHARIHAGALAQDVRDAFLANGLEPGRYAVFCEDPLMEAVEVEVEAEEQAVAVEMRPVVTGVEIVDGEARQVVEMVEHHTPLFDEFPLFDADGQPVWKEDPDEDLRVRGPDEALIDSPPVQATHRVPRMVTVTRTITVEQQKLDEDGQPETRFGLRYEQLLVLMHAWTRRELARQAARIEALEGGA